jgi:hypothetical protein
MNGYFLCFPYCYRWGGGQNYTIIRTDPFTDCNRFHSTRSSGRESAHLFPGSQSRLTSAATVIVPPEEVREKFKRVKPLKEIPFTQRGWTLDVLNIVRRITEAKRQRAGAVQDALRDSRVIGKRASVLDCGGPPPLSSASECSEFTNEDVYAFTRELEQLHSGNLVNNRVTRGGPPHPR